MRQLSSRQAMLLLVLGNLAGVASDICLRSAGSDVPIYQLVLFRQLASLILLSPLLLFGHHGPWFCGLPWHFLRAHILVIGALCMVPALASLPLASASALFHSTPLMMLPLALWWYREQLSHASISAAVIGFIGVLLLVQPHDFNLGALAALTVALSIACNNLLIRKLPQQQSVAQTLFLTNLLGIPLTLTLVIIAEAPLQLSLLPVAVGSSAGILIYTGLSVVAYRAAAASQIASAEYTALVWAALVGYLCFKEQPTPLMIIGAALIVFPMIWLDQRPRKPVSAGHLPTMLSETKDV